jgi:hypothetical protein
MLLIGAFDAVMEITLFEGQKFHDVAGDGFARVDDAQGQVDTLADAEARVHAGCFLLGCSGGRGWRVVHGREDLLDDFVDLPDIPGMGQDELRKRVSASLCRPGKTVPAFFLR